MGNFVKRLIRDIKQEFASNPIFTVWKLIVWPFAILSILIASVFVGLLNLNPKASAAFLSDIF